MSAAPGQDGYMYDGGDGYSGGGAYGAAGGSDGGDGEMSSYGEGGIGSGIDVKIYEMKNVVLRAGKGGGSYGGGAGVVLWSTENLQISMRITKEKVLEAGAEHFLPFQGVLCWNCLNQVTSLYLLEFNKLKHCL